MKFSLCQKWFAEPKVAKLNKPKKGANQTLQITLSTLLVLFVTMDDDEIDMMLEWEEAAGGAAPDQEEEEFNEDWEALAEVCVYGVSASTSLWYM